MSEITRDDFEDLQREAGLIQMDIAAMTGIASAVMRRISTMNARLQDLKGSVARVEPVLDARKAGIGATKGSLREAVEQAYDPDWTPPKAPAADAGLPPGLKDSIRSAFPALATKHGGRVSNAQLMEVFAYERAVLQVTMRELEKEGFVRQHNGDRVYWLPVDPIVQAARTEPVVEPAPRPAHVSVIERFRLDQEAPAPKANQQPEPKPESATERFRREQNEAYCQALADMPPAVPALLEQAGEILHAAHERENPERDEDERMLAELEAQEAEALKETGPLPGRNLDGGCDQCRATVAEEHKPGCSHRAAERLAQAEFERRLCMSDEDFRTPMAEALKEYVADKRVVQPKPIVRNVPESERLIPRFRQSDTDEVSRIAGAARSVDLPKEVAEPYGVQIGLLPLTSDIDFVGKVLAFRDLDVFGPLGGAAFTRPAVATLKRMADGSLYGVKTLVKVGSWSSETLLTNHFASIRPTLLAMGVELIKYGKDDFMVRLLNQQAA